LSVINLKVNVVNPNNAGLYSSHGKSLQNRTWQFKDFRLLRFARNDNMSCIDN
jgi:hypothetical protein